MDFPAVENVGEKEPRKKKGNREARRKPFHPFGLREAGGVEKLHYPKSVKELPPGIIHIFIFSLVTIARAFRDILHWAAKTFWAYLRHHPSHAAFLSFVLTLFVLVVLTGARIHDKLILSEISETTVEAVVAASKFTREFSPNGAKIKRKQEFLRVGAPLWMQKEAVRAVLYHARKAKLPILDQAVLLATVEIESGFNALAKAPSTTACGLFQFVKKTGLIFNLAPDVCMDPWLNAEAGVAHYMENYKNSVAEKVEVLSGNERLFATFEQSYYLHHDGPNSSNPSSSLKATVLGGTQFLFKVHGVLEREMRSREHAPTFAERFGENLVAVLGSAKQSFQALFAAGPAAK